MKLNPDCIRDVLLAVENCPFNECLNLDKLENQLPDYTVEDLWYTCLKLEEGNYLSLTTIMYGGSNRPGITSIGDLTYQGHEFLNSIRKPTVWDKVKNVANSCENYSLKTLGIIGQELAKNAIQSMLLQM